MGTFEAIFLLLVTGVGLVLSFITFRLIRDNMILKKTLRKEIEKLKHANVTYNITLNDVIISSVRLHDEILESFETSQPIYIVMGSKKPDEYLKKIKMIKSLFDDFSYHLSIYVKTTNMTKEQLETLGDFSEKVKNEI